MGNYWVNMKSAKLNLEASFMALDSGIDSQVYALPVSTDSNLFFVDNKKFGIPTTGKYSIAGKNYECPND